MERKQEKKNLYEDARGQDSKKEDTMDNWDEAKLREVVKSKHGNPQTTTDKVCKYFIEAVENQKYGWFWTCMLSPSGFCLNCECLRHFRSKWRRRVQVQTFATTGLRLENQGTASGREGFDG